VNGTVYLAGPITGLSWEGSTDWRKMATRRLAAAGLIGLSPLRSKDYLAGVTTLADAYDSVHVLSTGHGIVTRDRWDATRCDVLLVNVLGAERVSIGTVLEIAWADAHRTPIVLAMESGNVHDHAMVRDLVGFIVPTLDDALGVVVALLGT
jgi:nucleoside 2-deoxyribosyltransferase